MSYDPNDDPAEAMRKALEHRQNSLARVPQPKPKAAGAGVVLVATFEPSEPEPKPKPRQKKPRPAAEVPEAETVGDEPAFTGLPEAETEEAIADFIRASGRLVGSAGRAIQEEGSLARKQTHSLIDEITNGVTTVLDALINPEKYKP